MKYQSGAAPTQVPMQTALPSRSLLVEKSLIGLRLLSIGAIGALLISGTASAQTAIAADQQPTQSGQAQTTPQKPAIAPVMQSITVTADTALLQPETTGSRLGLTPLETPAAVFEITPDTFVKRGYDQVEDAVDSLPGVVSGGSPADPSQFVVRGFVGNYVTMLRDGIYVGPANMVTRSENAFNLQSVDLLSGPSSVLYGQGAVGGTVNVITKKPAFAPFSIDAYSSFGSFNTITEGIGAGGQITKTTAFRSDLSYYQSNGYVINANPKNLNGTGSLVYTPRKTLTFLLALDVMKDDLTSYYGTPYVSAAFGTDPLKGVLSSTTGQVIDARMRYNNYNTIDSVHNSSTYQPSLTITWQPTPNLTITDQAYYYHAARNWRNAETYVFVAAGAVDGNGNIAPANEIERDRFHVYHNQQLPGDSLNAVYFHTLFGLKNTFSAGYEFYNISFLRSRGFPNANFADFVDPIHPVQGLYATGDAGDFPSRLAPTKITDNAVYAEDALNVTSKLTVVTGIHFENFYLDRLNFSQSGAPQTSLDFSGNYHPFDVRVGAIYSLFKGLNAYGQFSTAKTPPGSNIFLVNASPAPTPPFQLSGAKAGEVGLKEAFPKGFGEMTLALYDISVNNILTANQGTGSNPAASSDNGQQRSKGVEFSTILHPVHLVDVNFNTAYTHARYGYFSDPNFGLVDTGNIPADVPATTSNLWADIRKIGGVPLEVGAGLRFVGGRYADNANQTQLYNYTTVDIYATYHLKDRFDFSARGKNLFNKAYASFTDINYPSEVILGAPRSYMLSFNGHF